MRETFEHKLGKLNNDLIRMGGMIEEAIASAITALRDSDAVLAKKVVDGDRAVDEEEKNIESQCLSIILREQPVARDLRKVSAALKMVTDMERIADNAADIAEISLTAHSKRDSDYERKGNNNGFTLYRFIRNNRYGACK